MLFKSYKSNKITNILFDGYFLLTIFFIFVSFCGFFGGADFLAILAGTVYLGISASLSLNKKFRSHPFGLLLCSFSFQFLNIPITFILFEGQSYVYGTGLESIPYGQADYQRYLPLGIVYLTCFWVAMWLAIILAPKKRHTINKSWAKSINLFPILLMGIGVMIVTWFDNKYYADIFLNGGEKETSWLAFVFFDHAYLVLAGTLLFCKLNEFNTIQHSRKISIFLSLIYAGSVFVYFMAGSKAAILVMFNLLIFYPLCAFMGNNELKIQFFKSSVLLFLGGLAIPLFYFALIHRINIRNGIPVSIDSWMIGVVNLNWAMIKEIFREVFYRFAQGGIDRFLLIFQSVIVQDFDWYASKKLIVYLAKSIINLLLPGTPFPEAYVSSSQLFPQVIANEELNGNLTLTEFIQNSNTQPYTLFGTFILLFGILSPLVLFLITFSFICFFNVLKSNVFKITTIYFFAAALSSFGIDSVIGNSAHLLVSIVLMYGILRICTCFSFNSHKTFGLFNW